MNKPLFTATILTAFLTPVTNGVAWSDTAISNADTPFPAARQPLPAGEPAPDRYPPPPPPNPYWQAGPWGSSPWGYRQATPVYRSGSEYDRLLKELAAYRAELDKAREDLQQGQLAMQEARAALDQAQTEHRQDIDLQNALSEKLAAATAENVSLQSRVTQLGNELAAVNESLAEHRKQAALLTDERKRLQDALTNRDEQLTSLRESLQATNAELELARSGMDDSRQQLAASQAQAQTYKQELDKLNARLEEQKQAMLQAKQRLAEISSARDSLRADLSASAEELSRVQATLEKAQTQAEQLRQARLDPPFADTPQQAASSSPPAEEQVAAEDSAPPADSTVEVAALESAAPAEQAPAEDTPQAIETGQVVASAGSAAPDTDGDGIPDSDDLCPATAEAVAVASTGCAVNATIPLEGVNFRYNSHELTAGARAVLDRVADILAKNADTRLEVAGHTDSQGNPVYNQWLSQLRAQAVRDYLIERGLDPGNISARGYGDQQPVAENTTVAGLVQNRRVELRTLP
ncbi:MAG: OmpA family protein [Thiogranum sp.]